MCPLILTSRSVPATLALVVCTINRARFAGATRIGASRDVAIPDRHNRRVPHAQFARQRDELERVSHCTEVAQYVGCEAVFDLDDIAASRVSWLPLEEKARQLDRALCVEMLVEHTGDHGVDGRRYPGIACGRNGEHWPARHAVPMKHDGGSECAAMARVRKPCARDAYVSRIASQRPWRGDDCRK